MFSPDAAHADSVSQERELGKSEVARKLSFGKEEGGGGFAGCWQVLLTCSGMW